MSLRVRGVRSVAAGVVLAVGGVVASVSTSSAQEAPSSGCAQVNDPESGLDGVQTSFQEISVPSFDNGERLLITMEEPTSGGVIGLSVFLDGRENLSRTVSSLPATIEVWGLSPNMRWETEAADGVEGEATVTWSVECVPAPTIAVSAACRDETGLLLMSIADQVSARYEVSFGPPEPRQIVSSVAGEVTTFEFGPVDDGVREVVVEPVEDRRIELIITDVVIACTGVSTTTEPPPSTASVQTTTSTTDTGVTTTSVDAAAVTLPTTGSVGATTRWQVAGGITLVAAGAALLLARRRPV